MNAEPTLEVEQLARELWEAGWKEYRAANDRAGMITLNLTWEGIDAHMHQSWLAVARHVLATRPHDRETLSATFAQTKSREFFHDGLSCDLGEREVTTVEEAYTLGYHDATDELVLRLSVQAEQTRKGAVS